VRKIVNLYSKEIFFKHTFFLLKTLGNFVKFSSFEQVFLGLESLCESFNNILKSVNNHGNLCYKNYINFCIKIIELL
jgi:hypothetical protein